MNMLSYRKLILYILIGIQSTAIGHSNTLCDQAKRLVLNFTTNKNYNDWSAIEDNAERFHNCKCEMAPVFYYLYRMKFLLPNSHALKNTEPNESILEHEFNMGEQIKILKACKRSSYIPLINSMREQNFDLEISNAAAKLQNEVKN